MKKKYFRGLVFTAFCVVLFTNCLSNNSEYKTPINEITSDEPSVSNQYSYFNSSFDFISFAFSDFTNCNEQRFNYIMNVRLRAKKSESPEKNMIVYDYRPSFNYHQDFQVIIIGRLNDDGILNHIRMIVPRNATLQEERIRLSHFKLFDNLERYLSSAYEEPIVSMNNILKKEIKIENELYEEWLTLGEYLIESGQFITKWYNALILNDNRELFIMTLEMTPDIVFDIYPNLVKEYIAYRSENE
jgi:hypothetical protein